MTPISFREAQLMAIGSMKGTKCCEVTLNNLQSFYLDDGESMEVIAICLDTPHIVIGCQECEYYSDISLYSDKVISSCIDILREFAEHNDNQTKEKE